MIKNINNKTKQIINISIDIKNSLNRKIKVFINNREIITFILILINLSLFNSNKINNIYKLKQIKNVFIDNITNNNINKYVYKNIYIPKKTNILNIRKAEENNNDNILTDLRNKIPNGLLDGDIITYSDKIIFQITSIDNQNKNKNISVIQLGECEHILKDYYNISKNQPLTIFKYDYFKEGLLVPIIEYEVYHNNKKLELNNCKDSAITIFIPILTENAEKSCIPLCDDNCIFLGYDTDNKKIICQCKIKTKMNLISEIQIQEWNKEGYYDNICKIIQNNKNNDDSNINDINNKDESIQLIKTEISKGTFNKIIDNVLYGDREDFIINKTDTFYQLTSTYNQIYNNYNNNLSRINLEECEKILQQSLNLDEPLLIFKMDYFRQGAIAPIVEYEIFDSISMKPLNLDKCKDLKINIKIPVSLNENYLFKYNISSDYYNTICYSYKTEKGTDILLKDRKYEYINNSLSICEDNCIFEEYNSFTLEALCACQIKTELSYISNISNNINKSLDELLNKKESINVFQCTNTFFSKGGIKTNIGSYVILIIILLNVILFIYFKQKGYSLIQKEINKILKIIYTSNSFDDNINNNPPKKMAIIKRKNNNEINPIDIEKKSESKIEFKNLDDSSRKENIGVITLNNNNNINNKDNNINNKDNKDNNITTKNQDNNNSNYEKYNDYELNNLNYNEAVLYDKRTYLQYYFSLIKRENLLIFAFITNNDYNPKIIKISIFSVSLILFWAINTIFIDSYVIHDLYAYGEVFHFVYQLPQIIYADIISGILITLIKFAFLSETNLLQIKKVKEKGQIHIYKSKIINYVKCKFILLFVVNFILLFFFWFYVGLFCSVFRNTQIYLIERTLISLLFYLLYPFILCLLPGIFRIPALKSIKKDKFCLYKFSTIIQMI